MAWMTRIFTFVRCFERFALTSSSQAAGNSDWGNLLVHAWKYHDDDDDDDGCDDHDDDGDDHFLRVRLFFGDNYDESDN